jgi:hypothetical protein
VPTRDASFSQSISNVAATPALTTHLTTDRMSQSGTLTWGLWCERDWETFF